MSIDLPASIEERLRTLAGKEGRNVNALVEEAIRQYLEAACITDLTSDEVADAQTALAAELPALPGWKADGA